MTDNNPLIHALQLAKDLEYHIPQSSLPDINALVLAVKATGEDGPLCAYALSLYLLGMRDGIRRAHIESIKGELATLGQRPSQELPCTRS